MPRFSERLPLQGELPAMCFKDLGSSCCLFAICYRRLLPTSYPNSAAGERDARQSLPKPPELREHYRVTTAAVRGKSCLCCQVRAGRAAGVKTQDRHSWKDRIS